MPVLVVPQELAEQLVGYNFHTGVLACGRRKPSPDLGMCLRNAAPPVTLVACPNVDDPENLGAIIRLCSASASRPCCSSRRVLRVSVGNAFRVPIVEGDDLRRDLESIRSAWGVELIATVLDANAEELAGAERPERIALLFGNEAHGLEREWTELCDRRITIPMHGGTDSLNVAVAAGISLFHFTRAQP